MPNDIIINFGSRFIEIGLAGSPEPLIRSSTSNFSERQLFELDDDKIDHHEPELESSNTNELSTITRSLIRSEFQHFKSLLFRDILIYQRKDESTSLLQQLDYNLEIHLIEILRKLFKQLNLDFAKESQSSSPSTTITIIENQFLSNFYRDQLKNILVNQFKFDHVEMVPNALTNLVAAGLETGLVIDLGWNLTTIEPVFEFRLLSNHLKFSKNSGYKIHCMILKEFVSLYPDVFRDRAKEYDGSCFDIVENFIIDYGMIRTNTSNNGNPAELDLEEDVAVVVVLDHHDKQLKITVPGKLRYAIIESVVFGNNSTYHNHSHIRDDDGNDDIDEHNVVDQTVQLIMELPIDLRKLMLDNVVLTGGISKIPGLYERFKFEVQTRLQERTSLFNLKPTCLQTLGPWCGASLYCSTIKKRDK